MFLTFLILFCFNLVTALPAADVIGGTPVNRLDYPWMGYLREKNGNPDVLAQYCGASAIGAYYVITAAHCVYGYESTDIEAVFGEFLLSSSVGKHFDVNQIVIHPQYSSSAEDFDVAIIILARPLSLSKYAQLNNDPTLSTGHVQTVLGWGRTTPGDDGNASDYPDQLQKTVLTVLDKSKCAAYCAQDNQRFTKNMMCAYSVGRDTCFGDSGGPMFVIRNGYPVITGLTSFGLIKSGRNCAVNGTPGFYSDVNALRPWVVTIVK